jgi:FKBP-type peptidyl-prolyl cis-trans isomerase FkpA
MKVSMRGAAALLMIATLASGHALAQGKGKAAQGKPAQAVQDKTTLATERDKVSYMIGMDVGNSILPVGADIDMASFERSLRNALAGGKPLLDDAKSKEIGQALIARITARNGQQPGATAPLPALSKEDAGLLVGSDVGRRLAPVKDEIDVPVMLQGLRTTLAKGTTLLTDAEARTVGEAFSKRMMAKTQADAAAKAGKNKAEGDAFLATNKSVKGVYTTPSGLQYMVLRQGAGPRPKPSDKVRVNYRGTLLDGTEFDSSYGGQPAEFSLSQVIPGWTEGVSMMPVGAKYRFWVPGALGYGEQGTPGGPIGPNATLVFDVELLGLAQ